MRFNIFAIAISLILIATVYMTWVVGRIMTSDHGSPVRGVQGEGQVLDIKIDTSCVEFHRAGGEVEIICPHSTAPKVETRLIITEKPKEP